MNDLGQHALVDQTVVTKMVELASIIPSDEVLDVGAGAGKITQSLLASPAHRIIAVEKDREYAPRLLGLLQVHPNRLTVVLGDALRVAEEERFTKIVANIPFHISEPLALILIRKSISKCILLVGESFATIVQAHSRIGTGLRLAYEVKEFARVPRSAFDPAPRTDAVLLVLTARDSSSRNKHEEILLSVLRQHDKLLKNALENSLGEILAVPKKQAHELSLHCAPAELADKRVAHLSNVQFEIFTKHFFAQAFN